MLECLYNPAYHGVPDTKYARELIDINIGISLVGKRMCNGKSPEW